MDGNATPSATNALVHTEPPGSFEYVDFRHAGTLHHYRLYVPPGATPQQTWRWC